MQIATEPTGIARTVSSAAQSVRAEMAAADTEQKNLALLTMAKLLDRNRSELVCANCRDLKEARKLGASDTRCRRLTLTSETITSRINALHQLRNLPDPVGDIFHSTEPEPQLFVTKVRVPIGVVLVIFESRPHVSINGPAVCLKAGNCIILRGASEAFHTNSLLVSLWSQALVSAALPVEAVQLLDGGHETVVDALHESERIQLVIPRGGKGLMETVAKHARIPVLNHDAGICHLYLDAGADPNKAEKIALDSKLAMPAVCNAVETLLVHHDWLPWCSRLVNSFIRHGVEVRGCNLLQSLTPQIELADESDWSAEYLQEIISIKIVDSLDDAIAHINKYGSHHTDGIVTENDESSRTFLKQVNSAVVLCNTSTMYCDGSLLGFGPEIGISTSILHARGPVGAWDLTSYKVLVHGDGHSLQARGY